GWSAQGTRVPAPEPRPRRVRHLRSMTSRSPIAAGVMLAALAALAFGVTTPVVAWAGRGVGPLATAALLYAGAAAAALALRVAAGRPDGDRDRGSRLRRGDLGRVVAIALVRAAAAPPPP